MDFTSWYRAVREVLVVDDEACFDLIRQVSPAAGRGSVALLEGDLTAPEALAYARALHDLGRQIEAEEVLRAVLVAEFGVDRVPQGSQ